MAVTPTRTEGQAPGDRRARRPAWLLAGLRVLWGSALVLAIVLLLFSTPLRVDLLLQQCSGSNCESGQLTPQGILTLQEAGIPPGLYASISVALYTFAVLVYIGAAVFIFWRRPSDPMAIFVSLVLLVFPLGTFNLLDLIRTSYPALGNAAMLLDGLRGIVLALFFYVFPDGRFVPQGLPYDTKDQKTLAEIARVVAEAIVQDAAAPPDASAREMPAACV